MLILLVALHILGIATCLGPRIVFIPLFNAAISSGTNERLDSVKVPLQMAQLADYGFVVAIITGALLFLQKDISLTQAHWAFKLKFVLFFLLLTNIGAFHIAKARVLNQYDSQMLPALQRLNSLAVTLMCCMVLFTVYSI